ncbi:MAG: hydroxymethylglutaryl-CoA synthase, partial [Myxococcota bacterium]
IEEDFQARVAPSLIYCQRVGNIMGATIFMALASMIDHARIDRPRRVGMFSYGSGCSSEFYSGVVTPDGQEQLAHMAIEQSLDARHALSVDEYERLLEQNSMVAFGTRNVRIERELFPGAYPPRGGRRLFLREIREFHREYEWVS